MVNPVPGYGITTPFKKRGPRWSLGYHTGVDIAGGKAGKAIVSATPGRVIAANAYDKAYGYKVIIRWGGYDVWYCHMPRNAARVRVGQSVKAGQRIGTTGSTGNTTGPHLHMELRVAGGGFAAKNFRDPAVAIRYADSRPKKKPPYWFGIDFRNFAGFDKVHGAGSFDKRLPAIVKDIKAVNREFVCALEIPNGKLPATVKAMRGVGYTHLFGDLGRHIFAKAGTPVEAHKLFDLKPRYKGDTKQGVAVIAKPTNGHPVAVCTAQLENEDATGTYQVKQATSLVDQFEKWCDAHEIPATRRFYAVDTNSDNRVRDEVFEARGYVDAFDVAYKSENGAWRSIVRWFGKPTKGKRIDLIAVPKGRPVVRARLRTTTSDLSDHLDVFVDIGSL